MKLLLHASAVLLSTATAVLAQNYQPQYAYSDPYSGSPQPQVQQPATGGYEAYNAPAYDKGGYSSGSSSSSYSNLLTWGQLEAHYAFNTFKDDTDLESSSGVGANLRVKLMQPLYLHFGLDRITSSDPQGRTLEITSFIAGGGVYVPLGSRFQLYGEVGIRYDFTSGDLENINTDDVGIYFRPGLRFAVTDKLELTGSVLFNNTENLNDRVIELSAYYALISWLDVGGGVDFGSDVNTYRIGGRWRWD